MNNEDNKEITCYSLNISNKFKDETTIKKELINIYNRLKRYIEKNINFKDISFIIGISNTESKSAKIDYTRTGKKGRPKKSITGFKIQWHFHIYVISKNGKISIFCDFIKDKLKHKGYDISKDKNKNVDNAINYIKRQCQNYYSYGEYFYLQKQNKKIR